MQQTSHQITATRFPLRFHKHHSLLKYGKQSETPPVCWKTDGFTSERHLSTTAMKWGSCLETWSRAACATEGLAATIPAKNEQDQRGRLTLTRDTKYFCVMRKQLAFSETQVYAFKRLSMKERGLQTSRELDAKLRHFQQSW